MKLLCAGDRNWTNVFIIRAWLIKFATKHNIYKVIHGNARGADRIAAQIAIELGIDIHSFPAQWDKYGRAAGPIRNQQMIDEGNPDYVVIFHDNIVVSKGSADMMRRAQKHKIPYEIVTELWGQ